MRTERTSEWGVLSGGKVHTVRVGHDARAVSSQAIGALGSVWSAVLHPDQTNGGVTA